MNKKRISKSDYDFIMKILNIIESMKTGIICWCFLDGNDSGTQTFWNVSCSDYKFYLEDERFDKLRKVWREAGKKRGMKIVFSACAPNEKKLFELSEKDNLLMNCDF